MLRAATLIATPVATFGLQHLAALLRLLPERDPHPELYAGAERVVGQLTEPLLAAALLVRFELGVLAELGFGLDLAACAADRGARRPRLRLAQDRARRQPRRRRAVGAKSC